MAQTAQARGTGLRCMPRWAAERLARSRPNRERLAERGRRRREYGSGEIVFAQGDQNDGVHCVSGGTVGIRRLDDNGNSVLLELAYPGDTIGYRSFLTGGGHKTSAEALGPSVVCHIDRATIAALLAGNPALGLRFLKRSIGELEHAHEMMFRQATLSNRDKLVHLLLVLVSGTAVGSQMGRSRSICRCRDGTSHR